MRVYNRYFNLDKRLCTKIKISKVQVLIREILKVIKAGILSDVIRVIAPILKPIAAIKLIKLLYKVLSSCSFFSLNLLIKYSAIQML